MGLDSGQNTQRYQQSSLDKSQIKRELRYRFNCKCHWTSDKLDLQNQLHQLKIQYNNLKDENQKQFVQINQYKRENNLLSLSQNEFLKKQNLFQKSPSEQTKINMINQIESQNQLIQSLKKQINDFKTSTSFQKLTNLELENQSLIEKLQFVEQNNHLGSSFNQDNANQTKNYQEKIILKKNQLIIQKQQKEINRLSKQNKFLKGQLEEMEDKCLLEQAISLECKEQNEFYKERVKIISKQLELRDQIFLSNTQTRIISQKKQICSNHLSNKLNEYQNDIVQIIRQIHDQLIKQQLFNQNIDEVFFCIFILTTFFYLIIVFLTSKQKIKCCFGFQHTFQVILISLVHHLI